MNLRFPAAVARVEEAFGLAGDATSGVGRPSDSVQSVVVVDVLLQAPLYVRPDVLLTDGAEKYRLFRARLHNLDDVARRNDIWRKDR